MPSWGFRQDQKHCGRSTLLVSLTAARGTTRAFAFGPLSMVVAADTAALWASLTLLSFSSSSLTGPRHHLRRGGMVMVTAPCSVISHTYIHIYRARLNMLHASTNTQRPPAGYGWLCTYLGHMFGILGGTGQPCRSATPSHGISTNGIREPTSASWAST
jgi:hypothetical protein